MKRLMYTLGVTYADYLLASRSECDIEAMVCHCRQRPPDNDIGTREMAEAIDVLRQIDHLAVVGDYDATVSALRAKIAENELVVATERSLQNLAVHLSKPAVKCLIDDTQNLLSGLKSPDRDQRARFEAAVDHLQLREKTPGEIAPILAVMERAIGRRGRPKANPPWLHEHDNMCAVRLRVAEGETIPAAALAVATQEGQANVSSRSNYLERLYRQKIGLREIKSPDI